KQKPRCPSCSRQARGQTSHWTRPSGRACQCVVGTVCGSARVSASDTADRLHHSQYALNGFEYVPRAGTMARVLLTVTTTHAPATDLGFLLVKHPDRVQSFEVTGGRAYVFYPEATPERCTAALLLELDLEDDRPYAATSLLSAALNKVWRTALRGES